MNPVGSSDPTGQAIPNGYSGQLPQVVPVPPDDRWDYTCQGTYCDFSTAVVGVLSGPVKVGIDVGHCLTGKGCGGAGSDAVSLVNSLTPEGQAESAWSL